MEAQNLFRFATRGQWDKVVQAYENNPMAREARITKSEDTALHIAAASGKTEIVSKLVETMGENASDILNIKNDRGNTALHVAAALGNVEMCNCMASKDSKLVTARNKENETPLFLAALHGKKSAFLCLHFFNQENDSSLCRKSNGDTILHSAITGEYFSLAFQIIRCYPDLVDSVNENGVSPLHILASKSNAFKSSTYLGLFDLVIYHCIFVDELSEEEYVPKNSRAKSSPKYPENYITCMNVFRLIKTSIQVIGGIIVKPQGKLDEENPNRESTSEGINLQTKKEEEEQPFPPNCNTIILLSKLIMKALLIILGFGISRTRTMKEKKVRHKWANLVMNELVRRASKYEDNEQNPENSQPDKDGQALVVPGIRPVPEYTDQMSRATNTNVVGNSSDCKPEKDDKGKHQSGTGTPPMNEKSWSSNKKVHFQDKCVTKQIPSQSRFERDSNP